MTKLTIEPISNGWLVIIESPARGWTADRAMRHCQNSDEIVDAVKYFVDQVNSDPISREHPAP